MKIKTIHIILTLSCLLSTLTTKAQAPYYTFLDGWHGIGLVEFDDSVRTISNHQEVINGAWEAWFKINTLDSNGHIIYTKDFRNDSAVFQDALFDKKADFYGNKKYMATGYNVRGTYTGYRNVYLFSNKLDSVKKELNIPRTNLALDEKFSLINYINDTIILLAENNYPNVQYNRCVKVTCIDTNATQKWKTTIYPLEWTDEFFWIENMEQTGDGGFFITCSERPVNSGLSYSIANQYLLLVKLDKYGTVQWRKRIYNGGHVTHAGSVIQKDSNSYLLAWQEKWFINNPNAFINGNKEQDSAMMWLGEIDINGNFKWKKSLLNTITNCDSLFTATGYYPHQFLKLSDQNYLLVAQLLYNKTVLIKLTPEGDVIWNRDVVVLEDENPTTNTTNSSSSTQTDLISITESKDGGFWGIGHYHSQPCELFPNGMHTSLLVKLDEYGCLEPGCHLEGCTDIDALNYDSTAQYNCGCEYEVCPNSNKITIDVRHYTQMYDLTFSLKEKDSEDILFEFESEFPHTEERITETMCLESNCDVEYALSINYFGNVPPNAIIPFSGGDRLSLSYGSFFNITINDSLINIGENLIKGQDTTIYFNFCIPDTAKQIIDYNIYPNPTKDNFTLEIPNEIDITVPLTFKVMDLLGRTVGQYQIESHQTIFNSQNWATGVYTGILMQDNHIIHTQKLIKL